jgi:hypothetical protein
MKFYLIILSLCLYVFGNGNVLYAQAGVPNGNFENWPSGNNDNPEFWDSPNALTGGFPFFFTTVEKTSDSNSGNWAASVTTGTILDETIPGVLSLGTLEIDIENIENTQFTGLPFSDRPGTLEGYYKYSTPDTDFGLLAILLTRYNDATSNQDSIAFGFTQFTAQEDEYVYFSATIQYLTLAEPDSINIVMLSSASPAMMPGSQLKIDDLAFNYSATPIVELPEFVPLCQGESHTFELEYVEGYSYTWLDGETGEVIGNEHVLTVFDPGIYEAVVQNQQGLPGFGSTEVIIYDEPGDANGDGDVNGLDIITVVNYFVGNEPDVFCFENADVNDDGMVNVLDVVGIIAIFAGN